LLRAIFVIETHSFSSGSAGNGIGSGSLQETIKEHMTKAIKQKKTILKEERVVKTILNQLRKVGK
jgi:hypothetical protein